MTVPFPSELKPTPENLKKHGEAMKYKGISAWIVEGIRYGFFGYVFDQIVPDQQELYNEEDTKLMKKIFADDVKAIIVMENQEIGWNMCLKEIKENLAKFTSKTIKGTTK